MAFLYPRTGTRAAEHMTPDVLGALARWSELPTPAEAKTSAMNFFRTTTSGASGLYIMTLLSDDRVALCFYGSRGGFRVIWNFGRADT